MQTNNCAGFEQQLRERRHNVDNVQKDNIQKSISHRKQKLEDRVGNWSVSQVEDKENVPCSAQQLIQKYTKQLKAGQNQQQRVQQVIQQSQMDRSKKNELNQPKQVQIIQGGTKLVQTANREVHSIIFDSKVTKFQNNENKEGNQQNHFSSAQRESYINQFQTKVDKINSQIEGGLTMIQQAIKELKQKKQQKTRINEQKTTIPSYQANPKDKRQQYAATGAKPLVSQTITCEKQKNKTQEATNESQIELQGNFNKKSECFPPEYISLINRLTRQIQRDIEFTNKVSFYTKTNQIGQIRTLLLKEIKNLNPTDLQLDQSFLKIQSSEIDPLDNPAVSSARKPSIQQIHSYAMNLMKEYQDLQTHYKSKLYKKFQSSTIELLFQQLTQFNFANNTGNKVESVTVGHLLSYLNMRTNKSFRNRSFVKMLKRLNLRSNSLLNNEAFINLIKD